METVMETNLQRPDETLEDLQLGGLQLLQKKTGFRFGMDSVLLADFAAVRKEDTVADFGTGTGILPLLLIGRDKGQLFRAIEIQEEYCEMASRTIGTVPYRMAIIWLRPQGSNWLGMRNMSAPA